MLGYWESPALGWFLRAHAPVLPLPLSTSLTGAHTSPSSSHRPSPGPIGATGIQNTSSFLRARPCQASLRVGPSLHPCSRLGLDHVLSTGSLSCLLPRAQVLSVAWLREPLEADPKVSRVPLPTAELEFVQIVVIVVVMMVMVVMITCLLSHYKLSARSFISRHSQARRRDDGLSSVSGASARNTLTEHSWRYPHLGAHRTRDEGSEAAEIGRAHV